MKDIEFDTMDWEDIKDKYFKIMLTPELVKQLNLNLVYEKGVWWIEVNKEKELTGVKE